MLRKGQRAMDYIDIDGKPIDLKKKAAEHIKKLKEDKKEVNLNQTSTKNKQN